MDNIKILAAVLILAGCLENGMGMEIQEDKYGNSTPENRLVITPENISQIDTFKKFTPYIFFENIDFTKNEVEQYWRKMSNITNNRFCINFINCIFNYDQMITFPVCHDAVSITFKKCTGIDYDAIKYVRIGTYDANILYE